MGGAGGIRVALSEDSSVGQSVRAQLGAGGVRKKGELQSGGGLGYGRSQRRGGGRSILKNRERGGGKQRQGRGRRGAQ